MKFQRKKFSTVEASLVARQVCYLVEEIEAESGLYEPKGKNTDFHGLRLFSRRVRTLSSSHCRLEETLHRVGFAKVNTKFSLFKIVVRTLHNIMLQQFWGN